MTANAVSYAARIQVTPLRQATIEMTVGEFVQAHGLPLLDMDDNRCFFHNDTDVMLFRMELHDLGQANRPGYLVSLDISQPPTANPRPDMLFVIGMKDEVTELAERLCSEVGLNVHYAMKKIESHSEDRFPGRPSGHRTKPTRRRDRVSLGPEGFEQPQRYGRRSIGLQLVR